MTPKQKQKIEIMRRNGLSYSQIAARLKLSVNTVKSFCRRSDASENAVTGPTCKQCGEILRIKPKTKPKTFCTDTCRYTWWNHYRKESSHDK